MATHCIPQLTFRFHRNSKPVVAAFDMAHASSDGGAVLLKAIDTQWGLTERLAACLDPSLRLAVHADQNGEKDRALAGRPWEACSYACAGAEGGFSTARTREGGEILSFFRIAAAWGVGRVL